MSSIICHSCGFTNQSGSLYCFRCGAPLSIDMCPYCRSQLPAHLNTCPRCGHPVPRQRLTGYIPAMRAGQQYTDPSLRPWGGLADLGLLFRLLTRKRGPIYQASPAVYERLSPQTIARSGHYLLIALILFFIGLATSSTVVALEGHATSLPASIIAAIVAPVALLVWMRINDRLEPEHVWLVVLAFGWGVFCMLPIIIINTHLIGALGWYGLAGFTEEPIKMLGVYLLATNPRLKSEFNDHLDGLLYGSAAGLGFAFAEDILFIARMLKDDPFLIPLRIMGASLHMFTTGLIGYWLGYLRVHGLPLNFSSAMPAIAFSIFTHMLWNTMAQYLPELVAFIISAIWGVVLIYFVGKLARDALVDEYFWGYAHGYAPRESR
ncbi:MAG: PrsW family glutamic-type intramembrane protease [Nitrososphaerota archaeon]